MGFLFVFRGKAPQLYFIGLYTEWSKQVAETNFYFPQRCAWFGVLVRSCLMQHVYVSDYWSNERFIPIPNLWPFPRPLCLNTPQSVVKVQASDDVYMGTSLQMVDWGQLPVDIMSNYMHMSDSLLSDIVLPGDVVTCSGGKCTNQCHVNMISNTHDGIMNCLQELMKCVLPEKQGKSEGFDSCDRPSNLKLDSNRQFSARVTVKFDGWPCNTIGHLFYATSSFVHHFVAIGEFKLQLQSGNAQSGSNSTIFRGVRPWNLTDDLAKQ